MKKLYVHYVGRLIAAVVLVSINNRVTAFRLISFILVLSKVLNKNNLIL